MKQILIALHEQVRVWLFNYKYVSIGKFRVEAEGLARLKLVLFKNFLVGDKCSAKRLVEKLPSLQQIIYDKCDLNACQLAGSIVETAKEKRFAYDNEEWYHLAKNLRKFHRVYLDLEIVGGKTTLA